MSNDFKKEIEKRRTFAIISHPDAGKTTLTEKFLLLLCFKIIMYLSATIPSLIILRCFVPKISIYNGSGLIKSNL